MSNNIDYELIKKALDFARAIHKNDVDKAGDEYIFHPVMVALQCTSAKAKAVALLHDTIEDHPDEVSYDVLLTMFGKEIADAVKLLSKPENMDYLKYVTAIKNSGNKLALEVKIADLTMNMDLGRISNLTQNDYDRIENKYKPALAIINNKDNDMPIEIKKVSITKTGMECVVNAANEGLWHGGGVCGYIFDVAGPKELSDACNKIGHCDTGSAVITPGFNLSKYIIHAVGPVWHGGDKKEPQQLYGAYKRSLELCKENNIHEVAFPLISAGIFGYPVDKAWRKALQACLDFTNKNLDYNIKIVFAVLDDNIINVGNKCLLELTTI